MKSLILVTVALVALVGLQVQAQSNARLNGTYDLLKEDCLPPNPAATSPHQLIVEASDEKVTLLQPTADGNMIIDELLVGDTTDTMLGGSQFRKVGTYSDEGATFSYQEYDNQIPRGPLALLRNKTLELSVNNLTITYAEQGSDAQKCVLVRNQ